jgi:hypothetical protein
MAPRGREATHLPFDSIPASEHRCFGRACMQAHAGRLSAATLRSVPVSSMGVVANALQLRRVDP